MTAGKTSILAIGIAFFALALGLRAAPETMPCESWQCGAVCAPAKYESVRTAGFLDPLFESPTYLAALLEGSSIMLLMFIGVLIRRGRPSSPVEKATSPVIEALQE